MNRIVTLVTLIVLLPFSAQAQDQELDTTYEKFSYAMGYRMARELAQQGVTEVDSNALALGVKEAMSGVKFRFTQVEIREVMTAYQQELVDKQATKAMANKDAGMAFLKENATKEGVKELENGVQYKILTEGTGQMPGAGARVKVHYTGSLIDGTEFDSSRSRGEPTELGVGDVIPGWQLVLGQMPVGSRWMVWIPPEQGYGMRGAGARIGPNATLIFDIELIEVVAAAK
jgi:FKBP-type peptidyl-prolyl cis-trans isomerase